MREEYELHGAKRGEVVAEAGKRRITILLDADVLAVFRERAARTGRGYQTLINQALRDHLANGELEDTLRRVMGRSCAGRLESPVPQATTPCSYVTTKIRSPGASVTVSWPASRQTARTWGPSVTY